MSANDQEEPLADVIEQHQQADQEANEPDMGQLPDKVPLEADAADAAEQAREVELDDDEYR